ncbi:putative leader peptide [Streptomyces sp. NRRL F-2747]|uniref:putative leader peptide n=1 Tax=Streptomyces sp. NRRL F-2747 TaxID=1463843 RepID=UPI003B642355
MGAGGGHVGYSGTLLGGDRAGLRIPTFPIGLIGILARSDLPGKGVTGWWTVRSRDERRRRSVPGAWVRGRNPRQADRGAGELSHRGPLAAGNPHAVPPAISYTNSREVLTSIRRAPQDVPMSPSQPLLVRRRHVDLRRVASAVCRPV